MSEKEKKDMDAGLPESEAAMNESSAADGENPEKRSRKAPKKIARKKGKKKVSKVRSDIFSSDMIIDSIQIAKKDSEAYIRSKAQAMFGSPDFYYGYAYRDGWLVFIAIKSNKHVEGGYSVFCPALVRPGIYYFEDGKRIHFVRNTDKGVVHEIGSKEHMQDGFVNLSTFDQDVKIPDELAFKWSMTKRNVLFSAILSVGFVCALAFWGVTGFMGIGGQDLDVDSVKHDFNRRAMAAKQKVQSLPNIPAMIDNVADQVGNVGIIQSVTLKEVKGKKSNFTFEIKFEKERDAMTFINSTGGEYENSVVHFTASAVSNN